MNKNKRITIRVTEEERKRLEWSAKDMGVSLSEYIRNIFKFYNA